MGWLLGTHQDTLPWSSLPVTLFQNRTLGWITDPLYLQDYFCSWRWVHGIEGGVAKRMIVRRLLQQLLPSESVWTAALLEAACRKDSGQNQAARVALMTATLGCSLPLRNGMSHPDIVFPVQSSDWTARQLWWASVWRAILKLRSCSEETASKIDQFIYSQLHYTQSCYLWPFSAIRRKHLAWLIKSLALLF